MKRFVGDGLKGVGEYYVGQTKVLILNLGSPEMQECQACMFTGTSVQMSQHFETVKHYEQEK